MGAGGSGCEAGDTSVLGWYLFRQPGELETPSPHHTHSVQSSSKSLKLLGNTARNQELTQQNPQSWAGEGGHWLPLPSLSCHGAYEKK